MKKMKNQKVYLARKWQVSENKECLFFTKNEGKVEFYAHFSYFRVPPWRKKRQALGTKMKKVKIGKGLKYVLHQLKWINIWKVVAPPYSPHPTSRRDMYKNKHLTPLFGSSFNISRLRASLMYHWKLCNRPRCLHIVFVILLNFPQNSIWNKLPLLKNADLTCICACYIWCATVNCFPVDSW
jgi:hypothetical protein